MWLQLLWACKNFSCAPVRTDINHSTWYLNEYSNYPCTKWTEFNCLSHNSWLRTIRTWSREIHSYGYNHRKSRRNMSAFGTKERNKNKIGSNKSNKRQHFHAIRPSFRVVYCSTLRTLLSLSLLLLLKKQQQIDAITRNKGIVIYVMPRAAAYCSSANLLRLILITLKTHHSCRTLSAFSK